MAACWGEAGWDWNNLTVVGGPPEGAGVDIDPRGPEEASGGPSQRGVVRGEGAYQGGAQRGGSVEGG